MKEKSIIQEYITTEPAEVRKFLKQMHAIVKKAAPEASEKLAWSMPTLYQEGNLVHFAAFNHHISLFPGTDAIAHFENELKSYVSSKGTVQFPYEKPIPAALVTRIVKFCVKRNLTKAKTKKTAKASRKKKRAV